MTAIVIRPTFSYKNDVTKPVRAGGVIIYRKFNKEVEILLINKLIGDVNRYEDIGGKTDTVDIHEFDTISREVFEETNSKINKNIIKNQIKNSKSIYSAKSKYSLYFIKANKYERKLKSEDFGDSENHDSIVRTIHWVNIKKITNEEISLHPRLKLMLDELKEMLLQL